MKKFFGGGKISFEHPFWRHALLLAPLLFFLLIFSLPFAQMQSQEIVEVKENNFGFVEGASTQSITAPKSYKPQIVLFSFDGSKSLEKWQDSLDFAQKLEQENIHLKFTYFISGVYFLKPEYKDVYKPFGYESGFSFIGYGDNDSDIAQRIKFLNLAKARDHEIASHLNGHMDGSKWTQDVWERELASFNDLIFNFKINNHNPNLPELELRPNDIQGLRAPSLGVNSYLWPALAKFNYKYDTSQTGEANQWPLKDQYGVWHFYFPSIQVAGTNKYILPSDYNLYLAQTGTKSLARKNTDQWNDLKEQALSSYRQYFERNFKGARAPMLIAHHFSAWNDDVYYEAMKDFAREICGQKEVHCITFSEAVEYLEQEK